MIDWRRKREERAKRHRRVRRKVFGLPERPRLTVFKSARHMYAQIVNDLEGHTIAAASTLSAEFRSRFAKGAKTDAAKVVGEILAEKAQQAQIRRVVFDRGGYPFHGRIRALASGAREKGLEF
ncbi:MAG: 50S ribosomal protein L18 [Candidatus Methylomirabilales bacterium]